MSNEEKLLLILKDRLRRHYKYNWKKDDLLKYLDKFEESILVDKDDKNRII